jgi:hypothetical protein
MKFSLFKHIYQIKVPDMVMELKPFIYILQRKSSYSALFPPPPNVMSAPKTKINKHYINNEL